MTAPGGMLCRGGLSPSLIPWWSSPCLSRQVDQLLAIEPDGSVIRSRLPWTWYSVLAEGTGGEMQIDSRLDRSPLGTENTPSRSYTYQSGDSCFPVHLGTSGSDERHFQFTLSQNPRRYVIDVALRIIISMKKKKKKIVEESGIVRFRVEWRQSYSLSGISFEKWILMHKNLSGQQLGMVGHWEWFLSEKNLPIITSTYFCGNGKRRWIIG